VTLSKLQVRLRATAGSCEIARDELSQLQPGDCLVLECEAERPGWVSAPPLSALWLSGVGLDLGILVRKEAGSYVVEDVVSMPQGQVSEADECEAYCRVSVEVGAVQLTVKQWRALKPGDAVPGLSSGPEVSLRVGDLVLAKGYLRRLGDLDAVCVTTRL
jgi:flagellar motor switch protein FliM